MRCFARRGRFDWIFLDLFQGLTMPDVTRVLEIPPHIRGLVFDCDGTIADTMPLHYEAWSRALREHGHDFPEALFYEMAGIPTARIIELLNERHGYTMPVQETADRKESLYLELIPRVVPIAPVVELVHRYAGKLPMAVATGGELVKAESSRSLPQQISTTQDKLWKRKQRQLNTIRQPPNTMNRLQSIIARRPRRSMPVSRSKPPHTRRWREAILHTLRSLRPT